MYGGVIQEITINELFKNPIHPYTKALMDSIPKMDTDTKDLEALKGMVPSILDLGDECKLLCSEFVTLRTVHVKAPLSEPDNSNK